MTPQDNAAELARFLDPLTWVDTSTPEALRRAARQLGGPGIYGAWIQLVAPPSRHLTDDAVVRVAVGRLRRDRHHRLGL